MYTLLIVISNYHDIYEISGVTHPTRGTAIVFL